MPETHDPLIPAIIEELRSKEQIVGMIAHVAKCIDHDSLTHQLDLCTRLGERELGLAGGEQVLCARGDDRLEIS